MPKIRRSRLPTALILHLTERIFQRNITKASLDLLLAWLDTNPEVPHGAWFKRFPDFTLCGHGELVSTFLTVGQTPFGTEV